MTKSNNQQRKSQTREMLDIIATAAVILGAVATYIGFVLDITGMLAAGSLAATLGICNFMTSPKKCRG